jgi:DNA sulfur modification protein DndD
VILDELVLYNFGVYRNRQALSLTPASKKQPIVLVGGLNGGGKTSLLDAVQLALYGPLANVSSRKGLAYDKYLQRMTHRGVDPEAGTFIELGFRTYLEGVVQSYRIRRTWSLGSTERLREGLDVYHNGHRDSVLSDRWPELVEAFVPRGVAPLFFFDAEQIERFADIENSATLLETAVGSLLGLDLVDRLSSDLDLLQRRKRLDRAPSANRSYLVELETQCTALASAEEAARTEASRADETVRGFATAYEDATQRYRHEGGELFQTRASIETKLEMTRTRVAQLEGELRDLAGGPACLLLARDLLGQLHDRLRRDRDALQSRALTQFMTSRDEELIALLSTALSADSVRLVSTVLADDRKRREAGAEASVLGIGLDGLGQAGHLVESLCRDVLPVLQVRLNELRAAQLVAEELERALADIPAAEALAAVQGDRDSARTSLERARVDAQLAKDRHTEATHRLKVAQRKRDEVERGIAEADLEGADLTRFQWHADKAKGTLQAFRRDAVKRHLSRIEQTVSESFTQLLRKKRLVRSVAIHPESMRLELRGPHGSVIEPEQLSAGERQLLAISMLWGLARASGRPLPVIIDTPLGRLDSSHRRHLLTRYFPLASHQVVLLSTDEEIDEAAFRELEPYVGRTYRLEFDDDSSSTQIHEGYLCQTA